MFSKNDPSSKLLTLVPHEQLISWLREFYGKEVVIAERETLRHGELTYVERLWIDDSLPESLIYKVVLPPWDVEQELHERVLIPSVSNSARLYLSAHYGAVSAYFLEDLGKNSFALKGDTEVAALVGKELAKMHRAYSYRTDELIQAKLLRTVMPLDYGQLVAELTQQLQGWQLLTERDVDALRMAGKLLAAKFAGEPTSLVHGDLFATNVILRLDRFFVVGWSWLSLLGVPLMDLATVTMNDPKNGVATALKREIVEAYCFESARDTDDVSSLLPHAEMLYRLLTLQWLVARKEKALPDKTQAIDLSIEGTVKDISERLATSTGDCGKF